MAEHFGVTRGAPVAPTLRLVLCYAGLWGTIPTCLASGTRATYILSLPAYLDVEPPFRAALSRSTAVPAVGMGETPMLPMSERFRRQDRIASFPFASLLLILGPQFRAPAQAG